MNRAIQIGQRYTSKYGISGKLLKIVQVGGGVRKYIFDRNMVGQEHKNDNGTQLLIYEIIIDY